MNDSKQATRLKASIAACVLALVGDIYLLFWLASLPRQWAVNASLLVGLFTACGLAVGAFSLAFVLDGVQKRSVRS